MRPMNRETVNMVRSPISVEGNIRLVPYYPAYDTALAWYQDAQLCKQVDNRDSVYDLPLLKRMYHYLDTHGELFYIEYRGVLCGDVSLRTTGELAIVICKEYQNKHIGRKVIEKMLEMARERGLAECFAHIYSFNTQSQKMFESIGFVPQDEERYIYKLQKGEPTMTKLTLEEKQELIRMALAAREKAYAPYSGFMVGAALRAYRKAQKLCASTPDIAYMPQVCLRVAQYETQYISRRQALAQLAEAKQGFLIRQKEGDETARSWLDETERVIRQLLENESG